MPEQPDAVNQNELRVVGMSRSGNHAIINWILSQVEGRYLFLNCADPKSNPFRTARSMGTGASYKANFADFDLEREREGHFAPKRYLVHSYEDCFLGMVCSDVFEEQHDVWVGSSARRLDVLILRDPFNLFASRKKSGLYEERELPNFDLVTRRTAVRIWKQHARAFLGRYSYFTQPVVRINYNRWTRDRSYRRQLAEEMGLAFTDAGFRQVPHAAGGSSFDGRAFDREADKMDVHRRWTHFADDPAYRQLFDEEMVQFAREIFDALQVKDKLLA